MLLFTLPDTVQAQDYTYTTNDGTITITGYVGPGGSVTIPSQINGLPVTRLGDYAFSLNTTLKGVTLGTNLTSIGQEAFAGCTGLTNVSIGNNAQEGAGAALLRRHDALKPPEGGSVHRPVAQGQCARCHAPHGAAVAKLLLAPPGKELCLKCHKDPSLDPKGVAWAVPHPALDDGCPACHQPHIAPAPRLLAKAQRELCAGCHEDKDLNAEGSEWATPHPPVRCGLCGSCHGPHGAPEKALLKVGQMELCTASCCPHRGP